VNPPRFTWARDADADRNARTQHAFEQHGGAYRALCCSPAVRHVERLTADPQAKLCGRCAISAGALLERERSERARTRAEQYRRDNEARSRRDAAKLNQSRDPAHRAPPDSAREGWWLSPVERHACHYFTRYTGPAGTFDLALCSTGGNLYGLALLDDIDEKRKCLRCAKLLLRRRQCERTLRLRADAEGAARCPAPASEVRGDKAYCKRHATSSPWVSR
jgi:hypothetical protein